MADITSSVKTNQTQVPSDGPYVRDVQLGRLGPVLRDLVSQGRYIAPSAITISSGIVTIPAGTVFYLVDGDGVWRFELLSAATITADATNNRVYVQIGVDPNQPTQRKLILDVGTAVPAGALDIGTTSGGPPPTTLTLNTQLDKPLTKSVFITGSIPAAQTAGTVYVVSPVAGTIKRCYAVNHQLMDATTVVKLTIGGVDVTGSNMSLTNAAAAGTAFNATPSAANVIQRGQAIGLNTDGAQTAALEVTVTIEIEP